MLTPVQIYEDIEKRLAEMRKSDRQFMQEAGLKRGILDSLKNGSMPSADKIAMIADYFGMSVDTLLGREAPQQRTPRTHSELSDLMHTMSDDDLKQVKDFAEFLVSRHK